MSEILKTLLLRDNTWESSSRNVEGLLLPLFLCFPHKSHIIFPAWLLLMDCLTFEKRATAPFETSGTVHPATL